MKDEERECPGCRRIYDAADVPDDLCPFCEPETRLQSVGGPSHLLDDRFSVELGWPQGEPKALAVISPHYMDAQLTKAQLEANGIPVLIEGSGLSQVYGLTAGGLAEYAVFVPQNFLLEARQILEKKYD